MLHFVKHDNMYGYMNRLKYILTTILLLASIVLASAQVDKRDVRKGNRDFRKEDYREADIDYRKALVKDSTSVAANYNLANNLYRQGDMEQARKVLDNIKESAPATESAADYYYNLGDVAIALQDWQAAVDALEQSLLRNPGDLDAKENYIYAKEKLQEQQNQQQQNQDQNNDQNQDQNKDDRNRNDQNQNEDQDRKDDKKDDKKDDQQDQNNDQDKPNDQPKPQQSQGEQPKITPQAAQQMLQAIQAKEKETQDKVNKEKAEALKARQKDKNW